MITLRKLASLKEGTRRRKYPLLLRGFEREIKNKQTINHLYFHDLLVCISDDHFYSENLRIQIRALQNEFLHLDRDNLLWKCNSIRHQLLSSINSEPGDWDFEEKENINRTERTIGNLYLFLDGIRSPFNIGSIFRSAESFGIRKILLSEDSASPEHNRAKRSSMGCTNYVPWSYSSIEKLEGPVFALELGGISLNRFSFPEKGTLIIGSEELGVSPSGIKIADSSLGRLSINTGGVKGSINVSVATGIALQKWYSSIF